MSQRKGWMWMLAGVILAMLAAMLVYRLLSSAMEARASQPQVSTVPVLVALQDIPVRGVVEEGMVAVRDMPEEFVPPEAATDINEVVGKMAIAEIKEGEVVLLSRLESPTNVTRNIALTIPDGQVVIALPAQDLMNRVGMVKPGDHVDLLFSLSFQGGGPDKTVALNALQNVTVQAVVVPPTLDTANSEGAPPASADKAILVAVDPQDALVIKYLLDSGASLDFALRAPDDDSAPFVEPVDVTYMEDMYEFEAPAATEPTTEESLGPSGP